MDGQLVAGMVRPHLTSSRPPATPPATPAAPSLMRMQTAAQVEDQVRRRDTDSSASTAMRGRRGCSRR
jgi:hypothetical protein